MVHGLTLGKELPDALQDMDADLPVVEGEPEETGLCLLISLFALEDEGLLLGLSPFSAQAIPFDHVAVVFLTQVVRADVFGAVEILAQLPEHVEVVAPKGGILDGVGVARGDADRGPIALEVPAVPLQIEAQ